MTRTPRPQAVSARRGSRRTASPPAAGTANAAGSMTAAGTAASHASPGELAAEGAERALDLARPRQARDRGPRLSQDGGRRCTPRQGSAPATAPATRPDRGVGRACARRALSLARQRGNPDQPPGSLHQCRPQRGQPALASQLCSVPEGCRAGCAARRPGLEPAPDRRASGPGLARRTAVDPGGAARGPVRTGPRSAAAVSRGRDDTR